MHEEPPRSKGGDPLDELDCLPLAPSCHAKRTGEVGSGQTLLIRITDSAQRCRGPLEFRELFPKREYALFWFVIPESHERYGDLDAARLAQERMRR